MNTNNRKEKITIDNLRSIVSKTSLGDIWQWLELLINYLEQQEEKMKDIKELIEPACQYCGKDYDREHCLEEGVQKQEKVDDKSEESHIPHVERMVEDKKNNQHIQLDMSDKPAYESVTDSPTKSSERKTYSTGYQSKALTEMPKEADIYYIVYCYDNFESGQQELITDKNFWNNCKWDILNFKLGNCFSCKEDAESYLDHILNNK